MKKVVHNLLAIIISPPSLTWFIHHVQSVCSIRIVYDTLSMSFQIEAHSLLARRPTDRFVAKAEPVGGSVIDINWLSIKLAISIRR